MTLRYLPLVIILTLSQGLEAQECARYSRSETRIEDHVELAKQIFLGRATAVILDEDAKDPHRVKFRFRVAEKLKGKMPDKLELTGTSDYGVTIAVDSTYVIFVYDNHTLDLLCGIQIPVIAFNLDDLLIVARAETTRPQYGNSSEMVARLLAHLGLYERSSTSE